MPSCAERAHSPSISTPNPICNQLSIQPAIQYDIRHSGTYLITQSDKQPNTQFGTQPVTQPGTLTCTQFFSQPDSFSNIAESGIDFGAGLGAKKDA